MRLIFATTTLLAFVAVSGGEVHLMKLHQDGVTGCCTVLGEETLRKFKGLKSQDENALLVKTRPAVLPPPADGPVPQHVGAKDSSKIIDIYARSHSVLQAHATKLCKSIKALEPIPTNSNRQQPEIRKIVDNGNQSNRIDVVFMGDGYLAEERDEFFDDIQRLTEDMFQGATFRSYLPLFNIWAIFVASAVSGIGYDGPINANPFQLYRQAGQLRAIYPGNAPYARQVCQLTGPGGCDYPSLIGNDDFYGGLGGEFVISTRSNQTGTVVLRHEMGHNFADVGEEYDGGSVYSGVNAARAVNSLGWAPWLTSVAREERVIYRLIEYLWVDLAQTNVSLPFTSDGSYNRWFMTISVTASGEADSLEFLIDNEILPWTSGGSDDREFYEWYGPRGFTPGTHILSIRSKTTPTNPQIARMVASVDLHEFGSEAEFNIDNDHVSAYPTWDYRGIKTFRPTNAGCLMRNMTHNKFCSVCQEGIWSQFLERVSLIDQVVVAEDGTAPYPVRVETLQLGQAREPGNQIEGELLEIRWTLNGVAQPQYNDAFSFGAAAGNWTVTVTLISPEIRAISQDLLTEMEAFTVPVSL